MLAMPIRDAADEDGSDHQGPVEADGADGIVENALVAPLGEGFLFRFGEAEVDLCTEHLADAEVAVGGEELLGAEEAEGVFKVASDGILAAFATVEGERGDARSKATGVEGQHTAVFVVRMGGDEEKRSAGVEAAKELLKAAGALVDGELVTVAGGDALAAEVGRVGEGLRGEGGGDAER